jgi:hypothetical protein
MKLEIELGRRFGKLVVVRQEGYSANGGLKWACVCDCGTEKTYRSNRLLNGESVGCGCSKGANLKTHGLGKPPEYMVWWGLKNRCNRERDKCYHLYGARGITVCKRWKNSFAAFFEDMGSRPFPKAQIDRIDNDGNYEPGNCRWTTAKINSNNTRRQKCNI